MAPVIAALDDEADILELLKVSLEKAGYRFEGFQEADDLFRYLARERPALLLLDLMLPEIDGLEVCRQVRRTEALAALPVIMLTAKGDEADKVVGLELGADDYVTKPFGMSELLARIRATLRHRLQGEVEAPVFQSGDLSVDLARRQVTVSGQEVHLTPKEYDLLRLLVTHAGKVLTHQQLLRQVWGRGYEQETHYLRVHIGQLRQKIETIPAQPRYILTEPGVGYRLIDDRA